MIADPASRLAARAAKRTYLPFDYPPTSENHPRWGYGRPQHARLAEIVSRYEDAYRVSLGAILAVERELRAIPAIDPDPEQPSWLTEEWLPELDAAAIYAFLRARAPSRYVEVGSGHSTLFAARARRDGSQDLRITSIDPAPRADIDAVCDEVIREPFESVGLSLIDGLSSGDVVFFDGSHRAFMNSDATVFFCEILPRLPSGVLVGIHDIFWPDDYPPEFADRYYSEQYLLAMYLLGGGVGIRPTLAANYVAKRSELYRIVSSIWADDPSLSVLRPEMNSSFWFTVEQ
jgi:predicted O-methyltransferase YrrM